MKPAGDHDQPMLTLVETLLPFVHPVALAVLLVYLYGYFLRSSHDPVLVDAFMGGVFGLAAIAAMLAPVHLADGLIIDIRTLFVGIAAAFLGFLGGGITLLLAVSARISLGGSGVPLGVVTMTLAAMMGLIWATSVRPRLGSGTRSFLVLGLMISTSLSAGLFLPVPLGEDFYYPMAPCLFAANLMGAVLLGHLIRAEQRMIAERTRLHQAATIDPLTRLTNRASAIKSYHALRDAPHLGRAVAMLCIDLDNFKSINDTYGHISGDMVLVEVATRMSSCLRGEDIFARMGGDEFLIVLQGVGRATARDIAERCRAAVSTAPVVAEGQSIDISVSIGGVWSNESLEFKTLRAAADKALYRAKSGGRDCVSFKRLSQDQQLPPEGERPQSRSENRKALIRAAP
jgi:diguanylate cyclase